MDNIEKMKKSVAFQTGGYEAPSAAQLIKRLYDIYDKKDAEFAYFLTWLAEDYGQGGRIGTGYRGSNALRHLLQGDTKEITLNVEDSDIEMNEIRFGAFFALCRLYRNRGELDEAGDLLNEYDDEFGEDPLFLILRSEVHAAKGGEANFNRAIEDAVTAETKGEDYIEVQHNLAHVFSAAIEQDYSYSGAREEISSDREVLLQRAASAIDRAIGMDGDYAKCYITKGKIKALQGYFEEAKQLVWRGIEAVDRDRPADEQVLAEFRRELSAIDLIKQRSRFEDRTEKMEKEFAEEIEEVTNTYQIRTLQILVFLAGFLAVIVALIQIPLAVESFSVAAQLVPIIVGSLLVAFGGFSFLLPDIPRRRTGCLVVTGILLIGTAIGINILL